MRRWAFLEVFFTAAAPIPDDPIVIPLELMKYSPTKLFLAYFSGKLLIESVGAYLGSLGFDYSSGLLTQEGSIIVLITLTIVLTLILLKADPEKLLEKVVSRFRHIHLGDY